MRDRFLVRFWGVRGTIPTPGSKTIRFGGNTPCIEVRCGARLIILDAGSGLREFGNTLLSEMPIDAVLLLSHLHWDHIQGFPVFGPSFLKGNRLHIYAERKKNDNLKDIMAGQMTYPHFPVPFSEIGIELKFTELEAGDTLKLDDVVIKTAANNHPDGCLSYRIEYRDKVFVYSTDTEHLSYVDPNLIKQADNADYLVYDSTYTDDEYAGVTGPSRVGWGHSTWTEGVKLCREAMVKNLILYHHDPAHDDDFIADIERQAREVFPNSQAAYEGLTIDLLK
jgi:phosphoribosyl 1,2-cyclic phosphodiesterase